MNSRVVLIETSWNVKLFRWYIRENLTGINRNIVECKEYTKNKRTGMKVSINRNIVECKG